MTGTLKSQPTTTVNMPKLSDQREITPTDPKRKFAPSGWREWGKVLLLIIPIALMSLFAAVALGWSGVMMIILGIGALVGIWRWMEPRSVGYGMRHIIAGALIILLSVGFLIITVLLTVNSFTDDAQMDAAVEMASGVKPVKRLSNQSWKYVYVYIAPVFFFAWGLQWVRIGRRGMKNRTQLAEGEAQSIKRPQPPPLPSQTARINSETLIYVHTGEKQVGPFRLDQLRTNISAGLLSGKEMAWFEGSQGWTQLETLLEQA